jgi:hypothetical protein
MITAVGKHVGQLTRKIYQAHGFAYAEILTHWETIIGPELAQMCKPQSIRWPRGMEKQTIERRKLGGTLVIVAAGPCAIELQHDTPRIIERLNTHYGYGAITALKIVQGHFELPEPAIPKTAPKLTREREEELQTRISEIEDKNLKIALTKLGRGAMSSRNKRAKS